MDQEKRAIENAMARYQDAPRNGVVRSFWRLLRFVVFCGLVPWLLFGIAAYFIIRW